MIAAKRAPAWDREFFRKSALYWPIAPHAARFEQFREWPRVADVARELEGVPVRFEVAAPRPRRARAPATSRYDERIATDRVVPTRERSWHDFLNALVWATFPRAKLALHERQHRMISARIGLDGKLPGSRTKEQDAVAMLDEGGVALVRTRDGRASCAAVFGHGIYEDVVCGGFSQVRAAVLAVDVDVLDARPEESLARADAAIAAVLARAEPLEHADFESIVVDEALGRSATRAWDAPAGGSSQRQA